MRKLIYAVVVLSTTSYLLGLVFCQLFSPLLSDERKDFKKPAIRHNNILFGVQPNDQWAIGADIWLPEPLPDSFQLVRPREAKIKTVPQAKAAAIGYLNNQPRFREAFEDLLARANQAASKSFSGLGRYFLLIRDRDEYLNEMVKVVNVFPSADRDKKEDMVYYWLVRVVTPHFRPTELAVPRLVVQELLVNANNGEIRPMIPWDRWSKPDTGKTYPPRIPKSRQALVP